MNSNLLELRNRIVHADSADGIDYTLCGISASDILNDKEEYTADLSLNETETEPYLCRTSQKISCPKCAAIIRFCCKLGTRSIDKNLKD